MAKDKQEEINLVLRVIHAAADLLEPGEHSPIERLEGEQRKAIVFEIWQMIVSSMVRLDELGVGRSSTLYEVFAEEGVDLDLARENARNHLRKTIASINLAAAPFVEPSREVH